MVCGVVTMLISYVFVGKCMKTSSGTGDKELVFDEWDSHFVYYLVEQD